MPFMDDKPLTIAIGGNQHITVFRMEDEDGDDPVRGVRLLTHGPVFHLDNYRYEGKPKCGAVIGSDPHCDISVTVDGVAELHCILLREPDGLWIQNCNPKNRTMINEAQIDKALLPVGGLLRAGPLMFVAFGRKGDDQEIRIGAECLQEYIANAKKLYGSIREAARAIGVPESTLRGWLNSGKFGKSARRA